MYVSIASRHLRAVEGASYLPKPEIEKSQPSVMEIIAGISQALRGFQKALYR
jgi:hypothetical protein